MGRHALEKITRAPKGRLRQVRNLPSSARAKAGLTWFGIITNDDAKAGPSEPTYFHLWERLITEKLPRG